MLWGASNNASTAMMAMTTQLGTISQNVANLNTQGYKAKDTQFQTMLSETHVGTSQPGGRLSIFGVQTYDRTNVAAQGMMNTTNNGNDLAINGRGFFMVSPEASAKSGNLSTNDTESILYTRNGSFQRQSGEDQKSYFVTGGGGYLLGWMADDTGNIPGITDTDATQASRLKAASSMKLEPVYTLPETLMDGRPTTVGKLDANLPSSGTATPDNYDGKVSVLDGAGNTVQLTMNWQRVDGTTWTVTPKSDDLTNTLTGGPWTVSMDGWGNISSPTGSQPLDITWGNGSGTTSENLDLNGFKPSQTLEKIYMTVYDNASQEHSVVLGFERTSANKWYLHPKSEIAGTPATTTPAAALEFNGSGNLISGSPASLSFNWTDSNGVTTSGSMTTDLTSMTQYDGELQINSQYQDGFANGRLKGTAWDDQGGLYGTFDNGKSRLLFKAPLASFVAENSLDAASGTVFKRTAAAGDITIGAADDIAGESRVVSGALEGSTVELEGEFTKMIMTQKAYSTNAQVFKTADEMTTTARDLKT